MSIQTEKLKIDESANICDNILTTLVNECVADLDSYVYTISTEFKDVAVIDNITLDNFILNLPMLIYYTHSKLETLGLRNDLSEIERKQQITNFMLAHSHQGTKSEKQIAAEVQTMDITILKDVYERAYKIVKSKIDTAYELLASCKKIMSRRIEELKVANSDNGVVHSHRGS